MKNKIIKAIVIIALTNNLCLYGCSESQDIAAGAVRAAKQKAANAIFAKDINLAIKHTEEAVLVFQKELGITKYQAILEVGRIQEQARTEYLSRK